MSIAELSSSTSTVYHSTLTESPDADFEPRGAWKADGLAYERAVRQRFILVGIVPGAMALGAVIVYGFLAS